MRASNGVDLLVRAGVGRALDEAGALHIFEPAADLDPTGHDAWRKLWSDICPNRRERMRIEIAEEVRYRMSASCSTVLAPKPIIDQTGAPLVSFPATGLFARTV
jgi:hypothetical protein